jgi:hypothetical protein
MNSKDLSLEFYSHQTFILLDSVADCPSLQGTCSGKWLINSGKPWCELVGTVYNEDNLRCMRFRRSSVIVRRSRQACTRSVCCKEWRMTLGGVWVTSWCNRASWLFLLFFRLCLSPRLRPIPQGSKAALKGTSILASLTIFKIRSWVVFSFFRCQWTHSLTKCISLYRN